MASLVTPEQLSEYTVKYSFSTVLLKTVRSTFILNETYGPKLNHSSIIIVYEYKTLGFAVFQVLIFIGGEHIHLTVSGDKSCPCA
jgi:hypothetical protein